VKVIFHEDFYEVYTSDPAASAGRMEAVIEVIKPHVEFVTAEPASEEDLAASRAEASTLLRPWRRGVLYKLLPLACMSPRLVSSDRPATMPLPTPLGDSATSTTWPSPSSDLREIKKLRAPMCWILTSILETVRLTS